MRSWWTCREERTGRRRKPSGYLNAYCCSSRRLKLTMSGLEEFGTMRNVTNARHERHDDSIVGWSGLILSASAVEGTVNGENFNRRAFQQTGHRASCRINVRTSFA